MQLTPMPELPVAKAKSQYKNPLEYIDDFMQMDANCVRVDFAPYEFINAYSAYSSFRRIVKMYGYPVKVSVINSELYLIKLKD